MPLQQLDFSFTAFGIGQALLAPAHVGVSLHDPGVLRATIGGGLYLTAVGLLGFGIGALVRHTAGSLSAFFAVLFAFTAITDLLPTNWRNVVINYLPANAGNQIFGPGSASCASTHSRQSSPPRCSSNTGTPEPLAEPGTTSRSTLTMWPPGAEPHSAAPADSRRQAKAATDHQLPNRSADHSCEGKDQPVAGLVGHKPPRIGPTAEATHHKMRTADKFTDMPLTGGRICEDLDRRGSMCTPIYLGS